MTAPLTIQIRIWQDLLKAHPELLEDEDLRLNTMEGETHVHVLLANMVRGARIKEAKAEAMKGIIKDMQSRKAALLLSAGKIRKAALHAMSELGLRKIEAPDMTISTKAGTVPLIEAADADADNLPDDLVRIKREPDLLSIREALDRGEEVPGFALGNKTTILAIRT